MCGISGILANSISSSVSMDSVIRMVNALRHRGPDGQGYFQEGPCCLGHARLAVIDTSETGRQPMTREGVTIVYNGELYNFKEERILLEAEGWCFVGTSDSEVLLCLYLKYGLDFLSRLQGMYSFALWDSRTKTLYCVRDPVGIKPLLYAESVDGFVFASEIKGLLASGLVPRTVDRGSLRGLLERGSVPQPGNIIKGVRWLLPGHVLTLRSGQTSKISCFRVFKCGKEDFAAASWPDLVDIGRKRILDALKRQLVADVPLGAFLSGGIDSSLLAALMAQEHGKVQTFSVGFEAGLDTASENETDDANVVARHLGVNHKMIMIKQKDVVENLRNIVRGLDHPTVDGVNSWFVAQAARNDLTVAISGTGGDELFAGYPWFSAMQSWNSAGIGIRLYRCLRGRTFNKVFDDQYRIFSQFHASSLIPGTLPPPARPDPFTKEEVLSRVTGLVLSGYTRDQLLADIDTASMWHGLEVRVPLLDESLLEFALSLPPDAKIGARDMTAPAGSYAATGWKRLLIDIGKPLLPPGFEHRGKRGFTLPFDGWLKGVLGPVMDEMLSAETVKRRGFFDAKEVERVHRDFVRNGTSWVFPWLLLTTELWAQEILDV